MCGRFRQKGLTVGPGDLADVQAAHGTLRITFGYTAPWQAMGARPLVNARAETVAVKPAWREAARARRCAVQVQGWTERHTDHRVEEEGTLWMAGLWWTEGFVLLTMAACPVLKRVHHRQPAFVAAPQQWTDPNEVQQALAALQAEPPGPILIAREA